MKKIKNHSLIMYSILLIIIAVLITKSCIMKIEYQDKIATLKSNYNANIASMKTYKNLYEENEKDLAIKNKSLNEVNKEFNQYKNLVAISKTQEQSLSRGTDYNFSNFPAITSDELNKYIKSKAPTGSPFIGRADMFIKASKESGLDPKFIFSLASLESGFGKSQIAQDKNNYFGINAYNSTPYSSSKIFDGGMEEGIKQGAKWIKNNYSSNGEISIDKMQNGNNTYSQTNSGSPNESWNEQLVSLMN